MSFLLDPKGTIGAVWLRKGAMLTPSRARIGTSQSDLKSLYPTVAMQKGYYPVPGDGEPKYIDSMLSVPSTNASRLLRFDTGGARVTQIVAGEKSLVEMKEFCG